MASKNTYWLSDPDSAAVAGKLQELHANWSGWGASPMVQAWLRNLLAYHSAVINPSSWDTSLVYTGEQGELVKMEVPHARGLIRQLIMLVMRQKIAANCIALADGSDVVQAVRLGNSVLDQIVETERVDSKVEMMVEEALVTGQGFLGCFWRTDKGKERTTDENGKIIYGGDLEIRSLSALDVYYDYSFTSWDQVPWVDIRVKKNRYDLIAQFPDLESDILSLPSARSESGPYTWGHERVFEDEIVNVYELYHRPTPAMPNGRMMMYSDAKTVYYDGKNRYKTLPIEVCRPEQMMNVGFGYPQLSNLLPAQEMLDHSYSAIATNQAAHAVQSVTMPRGNGVNIQDINGMRFVFFTPIPNVQGGGRPEPLQLTQSSPETFKFAEMLDRKMVDLSNLNPALRGNPPAGVTSGVAIATLSSNSLEFINTISKACFSTVEKVLMHALNALREFASIERDITLYGKNNQAYQRSFKGSDLNPITAVKINIANPLMQTVAGRVEVAEKLLAMPPDLRKDYVAVLEGYPLRTLYKHDLSEDDLIYAENEALQEGRMVVALSTDDHARHIQQHTGPLNDPDVRLNSPRVRAIMEHILEHVELSKAVDPYLAAMMRTGKQPEMALPPGEGGPPPGAPGGAQGVEVPAALGAAPETAPAEEASDLLNRGPM